MKTLRVAAAALALAGLTATSGVAWARDGGQRGDGRNGEVLKGGDFRPVTERIRDRPRDSRRFREVGVLGYSEGGWRHNRTALQHGFFGHGGTDGSGRYDYDRGYPYDHYQDRWEEAWEPEAEPRSREIRCRSESAVNVCRG